MRPEQSRTYDRGSSVVFLKTDAPFGGLSNMAGGFPLRINGMRVLTSEALYQACRFPHRPEVQTLIIEQKSPMTAKMKSKPYRHDSRADWDQVRVKIMRWCLRVKLAQNWLTFSELLLETGKRPIIEESRKDDFWGAKAIDDRNLVGMNVLGRLLMELREAVKMEGRESLVCVQPPPIPDFLLGGRPIEIVTSETAKRDVELGNVDVTPDRGDADGRALRQPSLFGGPVVKEAHPAAYAPASAKSVHVADLKPYANYKEAGLPWLGRVPGHWETRPAFGAFVANHKRNVGMKEKTVLSLSYGRIVIKSADKLHGLVPESFETYQIVNPGDIVLRTTDLQNDHTSLRVGMVRDRGIITSAYLALRANAGVSPEFGFQFLNVWDSSKAIYGYGSGLRQNLDFAHFKRMPVAVPPPNEQAAIVRFLDWANGRLERAVRAKRKVIALLNEQKHAIIHRAVTRGLDPSAPLKPSGIPWLGDIPQHWEVRRAKYLFREVDERSMDGSEELLSVSHLTGVTPRSQKNITMFKAASYAGHKLCRPGDLVINTMWAWMGALGVSMYTGIISPAYAVYRPRRPDGVVGSYIDGVLRSRPYVSIIICRSTGLRASRLRLYPDEFFRLPIIQPPREEQLRIVERIHAETAELDSAVTRFERDIDLLREYRTRLVADVVTGKLDVREAAARLPDEPPLETIEDDADPSDETETADGEAAV